MLQHLVVSLSLMLTILCPWVLNCTQLSPVLGGIQLNYVFGDWGGLGPVCLVAVLILLWLHVRPYAFYEVILEACSRLSL